MFRILFLIHIKIKKSILLPRAKRAGPNLFHLKNAKISQLFGNILYFAEDCFEAQAKLKDMPALRVRVHTVISIFHFQRKIENGK